MTGDHFLRVCGQDYFALQAEHRARGFVGESHDMAVLRCGHTWRLLQGPEPLDHATPPHFMRYLPYRLSEDLPQP